MKDDGPSGSQMTSDTTQHGHRIGLKHQNIASDHCIERLLERECGGIALTEADILDRMRRRAPRRRRQGRWSPIGADDLTFAANHLGNQECDVACATTNVVGGFIITRRMLGMFKRSDRRPTDAPKV